MGKPGTQVQLIKPIFCTVGHVTNPYYVTREIRIMYCKSRALQQICDNSFVSGTVLTTFWDPEEG